MNQHPDHFRQEFIAFAIKKEVLRFGEFKTKAGRLSPYFFNAGLFNDGESLMKLGEFYASAISKSGIEFDMLFGPAYKGITLVASIAIAFARSGISLRIVFPIVFMLLLVNPIPEVLLEGLTENGRTLSIM